MKDLWVPISGAIAQQRNVETIANNVANANTPGFKKDSLVFKEYLTALEKGYSEDIDLPNKEWSPEDFYRSYGAEKGFVRVDGSYVDHQQGSLTPTGNPFDLALKGKGFFEVLTPNGVRYTRNGSLSLTNQGELVTTQGHFLLAKTDGENPTDPESRKIKISSTNQLSINLQGEIFSGENKIAELAVSEFKDIHALKKEGNTLFINNFDENLMSQNKTTVYQGFVEKSNVNAVSEMSNLIKANRQFESIQKVIKAYDQLSGKAVNELARF